jgi:putative peptidoglycan lipid II flippase
VALLVVAVPMVIATRRFRGKAVISGVGHATLAGLAAGIAGGAVGAGVAFVLPAGGKLIEVGSGALATALAVLVFGVVAYALDKGDLRTVVTRLRLRRFTRLRA